MKVLDCDHSVALLRGGSLRALCVCALSGYSEE
jgi:hypothetical protein